MAATLPPCRRSRDATDGGPEPLLPVPRPPGRPQVRLEAQRARRAGGRVLWRHRPATGPRVGTCEVSPNFGFQSSYAVASLGQSCANRGLLDISEAECASRAVVDELREISPIGNNVIASTTTPGGCWWRFNNGRPQTVVRLYRGVAGAAMVPSIIGALCAIRVFTATNVV